MENPVVDRDFIAQYVEDVRTAIASLQSLRCRDEFAPALARSLETFLRAEARSALSPRMPTLPSWFSQLVTEVKGTAQTDVESYLHLRASQWQQSVIELLQRLDRDRLLFIDLGIDPNVPLRSISAPAGDLHNGGRSVYRLTFADHSRLIYKPRPVDGEYVLGRLIGWLRDAGCTPVLSACRVLPRSHYGWASFIETIPCNTEGEAESFYHRQGAFLALFYALDASDCLADNVVVNGPNPVWIDTECMCGPAVALDANLSAVPDWFHESILTTGMVYYANGLGAPPRKKTGLNLSCFTDRSAIFSTGRTLKSQYLEAVVKGFGDVYTWLLRHKTLWLASDGPLTWWNDRHVRVVPRATWLYTVLMRLLLTTPLPKRASMRTAVRSLLRTSDDDSWPDAVAQAEMAALESGNVPHWTVSTNSRDLHEACGGVAHALVTRTGMEQLYCRAARLSEEDLKRQIWLIRSFAVAAPSAT
jgi:lantibiotic modifying enzyme